jgi:hypothetical protein
VPVHRQNRLVQGQVWPSRNQTQQKICMLTAVPNTACSGFVNLPFSA